VVDFVMWFFEIYFDRYWNIYINICRRGG